ncbi:hypothetical protein J500_2383 [Acinetobacter sp. 479375]|nr:hypothetical protein J500_2383 [Acinetobacter sp. 479375]BBF78011.1 hypothetical protein URS_2026 [Acinetobacter ursingii]
MDVIHHFFNNCGAYWANMVLVVMSKRSLCGLGYRILKSRL